MKSMIKDAAILFLITLISGVLLGLVYEVTKEPIQQAKDKAKTEAFQEVFNNADSFETVSDEPDLSTEKLTQDIWAKGYKADINEVNAALDASKNILGYVITVTDHEGYGGDIQFTVGIVNDGTINGISILSISETAGLGMRAEEVLKPQFPGKNVQKFTYTKTGAAAEDQIDAISGATITTNAVTNGMNAALDCFYTYLFEEGGKQ